MAACCCSSCYGFMYGNMRMLVSFELQEQHHKKRENICCWLLCKLEKAFRKRPRSYTCEDGRFNHRLCVRHVSVQSSCPGNTYSRVLSAGSQLLFSDSLMLISSIGRTAATDLVAGA
jgi:hypothetical protein